MNIDVLKTEDGGELVVLSRREFDALLARAGDEDAEDRMTLLLAAEARAEAPLPAPVSAALLAGESLVRALRKWRGMTQSQLATASGIAQGYLSEVENGTKNAAPETLAKITKALDLPSGWTATVSNGRPMPRASRSPANASCTGRIASTRSRSRSF